MCQHCHPKLPMLTTFDYFWLTFLFFCILDCFSRVFKGLLLVLKDTFLLLFVLKSAFFVPEVLPQDYTSSIPSPGPKLSTGSQVIHRLSTGYPQETWHDSCIALGIHRINGKHRDIHETYGTKVGMVLA